MVIDKNGLIIGVKNKTLRIMSALLTNTKLRKNFVWQAISARFLQVF